MITNMTKREFVPWGFENIFGCLPLIVHCFAPTDTVARTLNPLVSYACAFILMFKFYFEMYLMAQQYLALNQDWWFWTIKPKDE